MAGEQISPYFGNKIVRWMLNAADLPTRPTSLYLALYNGDPFSGGTEVTTTIRAAGRVIIDWEATPASGTDNEVLTDADVDFGVAVGAATVDHVAIYDAQSGGNILIGAAVTSQAVVLGANVSVPSASLDMRIGEG